MNVGSVKLQPDQSPGIAWEDEDGYIWQAI